jgi:hypothetical protein
MKRRWRRRGRRRSAGRRGRLRRSLGGSRGRSLRGWLGFDGLEKAFRIVDGEFSVSKHRQNQNGFFTHGTLL